MKVKTIFLLMSLCASVAIARTTTDTPPVPRVSVFSTTVDWAAVTGLPWRQYTGKISGTDKSFVKQGLVLYYLDSFPCYGEADSVRVWLSPNGKMSGNLRLVCVHKPETISFSWRNADEQALDSVSTGIITCPVNGDRNFTVDITQCQRGKDWKEYK
ncbi:MAG: hypothetical protein IJL05_02945 [Alphaproteobacteria bacterium]|nr:hypothetical protein [Alphaproteobacteria bacterium]